MGKSPSYNWITKTKWKPEPYIPLVESAFKASAWNQQNVSCLWVIVWLKKIVNCNINACNLWWYSLMRAPPEKWRNYSQLLFKYLMNTHIYFSTICESIRDPDDTFQKNWWPERMRYCMLIMDSLYTPTFLHNFRSTNEMSEWNVHQHHGDGLLFRLPPRFLLCGRRNPDSLRQGALLSRQHLYWPTQVSTRDLQPRQRYGNPSNAEATFVQNTKTQDFWKPS